MKILHIEDNPNDAELVSVLLMKEWPDCSIRVISSEPELKRLLEGDRFDIILSDFAMGGFDGLQALKIAREKAPATPFIFLSGTIGEERAIEAVHAGAEDYVLKDRMKRLITVIQRSLRTGEERKQRRDAEQTMQRFASILESTPNFVGMAALNGKIFYVNIAGLRMVGLPESQDPGVLSIQDFYPPDAGDRIMTEAIPAALRYGIWMGETTLLSRDGRHIPVSQVIIAHQPLDGGERYMSTVMHDLTSFRHAEQRIREQAELLDKARDAIIVTDLEGFITFWNQGAERISGLTSTEVIGRDLQTVLGPGAHDGIVAARKALEEAGEWRGEFHLNNKAGQPLVLEISSTLVRDNSGKPKARLSIGTDVTAKKTLEEQFFRAQRLESIGMLAAGIAHDLNNVLAPILMAAPLLREHAVDPMDLRIISTLEKSAERGTGLVKQILAFAQGVSGAHQLVQVKHLLKDVTDVIRETFPKDVTFESTIDGDLWPIKGNATQIHQVLINLCVNARDAMPGGGKLTLRAENCHLDKLAASAIEGASAGSWVVLHVEDNGAGIPPQVLERIWEPFFTTKEINKGTGLGLSTVRGIVENHHGFISLKTKVGRGTEFRVYLPAAEVTLPGQKAGSEHPFAARGDGELILVVDDEAQIRDVTAATLTHFGYRVVAAKDGVEALALFAARNSEISAVVTDMSMPNLDGVALAKVVRHLNPAVKVLTVSGLASKDQKIQSQQNLGAFLLKPFKAEALIHAVHKLLHPDSKTGVN
jgi:two-component system, cell cycle sensor histidine kinase and response regulator CckA